ncbi:MAG: hypothetical protein MUC97_05650 [Bernardetiaceae bacterium]|jgi:hypothetical protein|nr:hypothetical protein [Bernardetiaceae bacterium]
MKHHIHLFAFSTCLLLASACGIKGHNKAELIPVNAADERIYGDPGGPARQTLNKYEDDKTGKTQERVANLRQKLFPK